MDGQKLNGIVIRAADYKDNDRLIKLYTPEVGKIQAVLRGVKREKAKLKFAAQLFHFGEYMLAARSGGFPTVTGCASHEAFAGIYAGGRPDAYFAASFVLDLTDKATPDREANPEMFICLSKTLREFLKKETDPKTAAAYFTVKCLRAAGYRYKFDECAACGAELRGARRFDAYAGGAVCPVCGGPYSFPVSGAAGNALRLLAAGEFEDLSRLKFNEKEIRETLKILTAAAQYAFGTEVKMFDQ
ncbi:MAG: DNA repair protein RecO [Clostridiales bacterium]|jgi:DNA repair protein RecO (recombination protein O)|nr:DNA repair protein RecO [Clostridiales bacterium]